MPSLLKNLKAYGEKSFQSSSSSLRLPSKTFEGNGSSSAADQYAVMLSCRCNYTGIHDAFNLPDHLIYFNKLMFPYSFTSFYLEESRLFFKQPTSWRPRISRDLMISVASEISGQSSEANERVTQLPVQVFFFKKKKKLILVSIYHPRLVFFSSNWFKMSGLNSSGIKFDIPRSNFDSSCSDVIYLSSFGGILEFFSNITNEPIYWFFRVYRKVK